LRAQALLRARYRQLGDMDIELLSVIAVRLERVMSWGDLSVDRLVQPAEAGQNQEQA